MKKAPTYTEYHPKWHRTRVSTYWWLRRWSYLIFILREISSVFVAYFVGLTLLLIDALRRGPGAYAEFQDWLKSPVLVTVNVLGLVFVLLHTVTWFNLAPRAMAFRVRGERVPDLWITAPNYGAWLVISLLVAWIILRTS